MMAELTVDLVEEILCHVPATSLKRLRSTCKRWNRLFNDSRFARKHSEKAAKQFLVLVLKEYRVRSMSVDLRGFPSVEITGELSLIDPLPIQSIGQFEIDRIFHYEGLLLCTSQDEFRIVVWNPCTGRSRWILPGDRHKLTGKYALGSCRDNSSASDSYKILSYYWFYGIKPEFKIYDINSSDSWRVLDVTPDCDLVHSTHGVSLKGKTYWFALEDQLDLFLVSFDFATESFARLCLPFHCPVNSETLALSVVGEEKLSVLLQRGNTPRTEVWVTNKIDETKVVSWSKFLAVDFQFENDVSFVLHEEMKVLMCCDKYFSEDETEGRNMVYIVGEDNQVRQVDLGVESHWPFLLHYVPSLAQLQ